jgi:hypothetical protein
MSFQWIIDNAEAISIDTQPNVSTTITRDGTARSTSRGGDTWRFTVTAPDGPRWSDYRNNIALAQALGRTTTANIQINDTGQTSWLNAYQGNCANVNAVTASWTTGNTITLTGGQAASGFNFKAGDFIQLGSSGRVYQVAANVAFNSNTVTLNRPIIDAAGSATLRIGPAVTWNVLCTGFPTWTIFARDQVSWSGPFVFYENLV